MMERLSAYRLSLPYPHAHCADLVDADDCIIELLARQLCEMQQGVAHHRHGPLDLVARFEPQRDSLPGVLGKDLPHRCARFERKRRVLRPDSDCGEGRAQCDYSRHCQDALFHSILLYQESDRRYSAYFIGSGCVGVRPVLSRPRDHAGRRVVRTARLKMPDTVQSVVPGAGVEPA